MFSGDPLFIDTSLQLSQKTFVYDLMSCLEVAKLVDVVLNCIVLSLGLTNRSQLESKFAVLLGT